MIIKDRKELIKLYLDFFRSKGHAIIPSASLIPENDPTVLFTTAGMHPLVPFLMGQKHPLGKRLANVQKCIRTSDIDEVGDAVHHTFFEMLGNWSLGDYFKKEAIEFSFEFMTSKKWLGLPIDKLAVSCFAGDRDAPKDTEAESVWLSLGIKKERIAFLPKSNNWWGPAGSTGPCGPDTEMFFWKSSKPVPKQFNPDEPDWVEIWNDVFMQYVKDEKGNYNRAKQQNVDTGMGVERTLAVLNGLDDNYKTTIFLPIIKSIEHLSGKSYEGNEKAMRIIADHIRAATFILGDERGIKPSNIEQGYVLRRLIRRAIRYGKSLGIQNFIAKIADIIIDIYSDYPELSKNRRFIIEQLNKEEEKFNLTIEKGFREFERLAKDKKQISGKEAFLLFQSFGFPIEMTKELAYEQNIKVDMKGYYEEMLKHQELSRTSSAGMFKSGLADNSEKTTKLHTATHLLNEALRKVLGKDVRQKGSNINPERLRFDFNFHRKLTDEEIKKVEKYVNDIINESLPVTREEMKVNEAIKSGAQAEFGAKYPEIVSVYTIGSNAKWFSKEICTGPHVNNTKDIGKFKIIKEEAVASGIRRIKATIE